MRLIDADALMEILMTAIRNMKGMAKFLDAEDDPEIQMEIKAYTDIADGVKDMPTIEPQRKKGKWINVRHDNIAECDQCGITGRAWMNFCFNCGADMTEKSEEPKKCDTCRHVKSQWFNRCADCFDYELWESKE